MKRVSRVRNEPCLHEIELSCLRSRFVASDSLYVKDCSFECCIDSSPFKPFIPLSRDFSLPYEDPQQFLEEI